MTNIKTGYKYIQKITLSENYYFLMNALLSCETKEHIKSFLKLMKIVVDKIDFRVESERTQYYMLKNNLAIKYNEIFKRKNKIGEVE